MKRRQSNLDRMSGRGEAAIKKTPHLNGTSEPSDHNEDISKMSELRFEIWVLIWPQALAVTGIHGSVKSV